MLNFVLWIVGGIVAGWITGLLVKGKGFGVIGDLLVGLLGGLLGGWLGGLLGIQATSWIGNIGLAVIGGVILVALVRLIRR